MDKDKLIKWLQDGFATLMQRDISTYDEFSQGIVEGRVELCRDLINLIENGEFNK